MNNSGTSPILTELGILHHADTVSPYDESQHGKPLWAVYGHDWILSLACCVVKPNDTGTPIVWAWSPRRRGFHGLGMSLGAWLDASALALFFTEPEPALRLISKLSAPTPEA